MFWLIVTQERGNTIKGSTQRRKGVPCYLHPRSLTRDSLITYIRFRTNTTTHHTHHERYRASFFLKNRNEAATVLNDFFVLSLFISQLQTSRQLWDQTEEGLTKSSKREGAQKEMVYL